MEVAGRLIKKERSGKGREGRERKGQEESEIENEEKNGKGGDLGRGGRK